MVRIDSQRIGRFQLAINGFTFSGCWFFEANKSLMHLQGLKAPLVFSILRLVDDLGLLWNIVILSWEKDARIMYRARFSMASSSGG
jgi:hypothetical protein